MAATMKAIAGLLLLALAAQAQDKRDYPVKPVPLYKDGEEGKPVENTAAYGLEKDRFNRVSFKPVTTDSLRVEVIMQPNFSVGIQKWIVK